MVARKSRPVLVDGWAFLGPSMHPRRHPSCHRRQRRSDACAWAILCSVRVGRCRRRTSAWYNERRPSSKARPSTFSTVPPLVTTPRQARPACAPTSIMSVGVEVPVPLHAADAAGRSCRTARAALPVPHRAAATQWYLNGEELSTDECIEQLNSGVYTVFVDYERCPARWCPSRSVVTGVPGRP